MTTWKIAASTHGMSCAGCAESARRAIGLARATGSIGATCNDSGYHTATVRRTEGE